MRSPSFAVATCAAVWLLAPAAFAQKPRSSEVQPFNLRRDAAGSAAAQAGRGLARRGDCQAALAAFDEAVRANMDPTLRRDRGLCHEKLGNLFPAIDDLRVYLTAMPDAPDADAIRVRLLRLEEQAGVGGPAKDPPANDPDSRNAAGVRLSINGSNVDGDDRKADRSGERAPDEKPAPNSVYLEGLGAGPAYSINYERRFADDYGFRAGFSYLRASTSAAFANTSGSARATIVSFPLTFSYLGVRGRTSGLELGGGATLVYSGGAGTAGVVSTSKSGLLPIGLIMAGYRYHPAGGAGFQFRIGGALLVAEGLAFKASVDTPGKLGAIPWGYVSFGAGF